MDLMAECEEKGIAKTTTITTTTKLYTTISTSITLNFKACVLQKRQVFEEELSELSQSFP